MKILYLAPEGFDYSSNQITEGLWLLRKTCAIKEFWCTNAIVHHGSQIEKLDLLSKTAIEDVIPEADVILLSSGGDMKFLENFDYFEGRRELLHKKGIFLDGHDSNCYLVDPSMFKLYLKRELRYPEVNDLVWHNVRSFQFGVYQFHFDHQPQPYEKRDVDVSFVAYGGSSKLRQECVDHLNAIAKRTGLNIVANAPNDGQPLSIPDYRSLMRRSKCIVSVPGAGIDTLRYWEAIGFGAAVCTPDISKVLHMRFMPEPHRHALYFHNWQHMEALLVEIVKNEGWWKRLTGAAIRHAQKYHSTVARATQMLELFEELV